MKLNRNELKKIAYDYNSLSNRLLQADCDDFNNVLARFVQFFDRTNIIHDYIQSCGICDWDMKQEFDEVQSGNAIFSLGSTDEEEIRNVYAILSYIVDNNICIQHGVGLSYSNARKYQEVLKDFNDRVTMVLIGHIETYLTKVGIDMGVDDKVIYNISFKNGQLNIANDNANITATNTVNGIELNELEKLISSIKAAAKSLELSEDDKENLSTSLETIAKEAKSDNPGKKMIKMALGFIKGIKGTVEFGAAVTTLVQYLQPFLG